MFSNACNSDKVVVFSKRKHGCIYIFAKPQKCIYIHTHQGCVPFTFELIRYLKFHPLSFFPPVLYSLCNKKTHSFQCKTLTFNILNQSFYLFFPEILVCFHFSYNQMKAFNIYLFLIKCKLNYLIFWQTNRGLLLKLIHGRKCL